MVDRPAEVEAERLAEEPVDTADREQVNLARKRAARRDRGRLSVVESLMDLKEGRAWMHDLLQSCHIWTPSFVPGDQAATAFREGERNVGLRVLSDVMMVSAHKYGAMCTEAARR